MRKHRRLSSRYLWHQGGVAGAVENVQLMSGTAGWLGVLPGRADAGVCRGRRVCGCLPVRETFGLVMLEATVTGTPPWRRVPGDAR
jgi:hypothetical protein